MRLILISTVLLTLLIVSCRKEDKFRKYKDAKYHSFNDNGYTPDSLENSIYHAPLNNNQIVHIASQPELDSLHYYTSYLGGSYGTGISEYYTSHDFSNSHLFVFRVFYDSKTYGKMSKCKIEYNDVQSKLFFDFKMDIKIGGSGMYGYSKYIVVEIPLEKSGFNMHGSIELNARAYLGGRGHEYSEDFTLWLN